MLQTSQQLDARQINLVSLRENIDISTATGRGFLSLKPEVKAVVVHEPILTNWRTPEFCIKIQLRRRPRFVN